MYSRQMTHRLEEWTGDVMGQCDVGMKEAPVAVQYLEGACRLLAPLL